MKKLFLTLALAFSLLGFAQENVYHVKLEGAKGKPVKTTVSITPKAQETLSKTTHYRKYWKPSQFENFVKWEYYQLGYDIYRKLQNPRSFKIREGFQYYITCDTDKLTNSTIYTIKLLFDATENGLVNHYQATRTITESEFENNYSLLLVKLP